MFEIQWEIFSKHTVEGKLIGLDKKFFLWSWIFWQHSYTEQKTTLSLWCKNTKKILPMCMYTYAMYHNIIIKWLNSKELKYWVHLESIFTYKESKLQTFIVFRQTKCYLFMSQHIKFLWIWCITIPKVCKWCNLWVLQHESKSMPRQENIMSVQILIHMFYPQE